MAGTGPLSGEGQPENETKKQKKSQEMEVKRPGNITWGLASSYAMEDFKVWVCCFSESVPMKHFYRIKHKQFRTK